MKPSLIIFLSITLISTSCGHGGLSKKVAKDKIHQAEGYPLIIDYKFMKFFTKNENTTGYGVTLNVESDEFKLKKKMIEEFEKKGLVELKEEPYSEEGITLLGKTVQTGIKVNVKITDKGMRYLAGEDENTYTVKLWEEEIEKIHSIQEEKKGDNKYASVAYVTFNTKISPFGECFSDKRQTINKNASFAYRNSEWVVTPRYGE